MIMVEQIANIDTEHEKTGSSVTQESYFAQFEETSGHQSRIPLKVLLEMQERGWIRRVPQGPQRCDYW